MMMAGENVESNAFLQMYDTLSTGIREALLSIAEAALSRKIIHENTYSEALNLGYPTEVRTQNFLKAIRDRIRLDPLSFHVFVSILESQHSMEYLGTKLKQSLRHQLAILDTSRQQAAAENLTLAVHTEISSLREGEMPVLNRFSVSRPTKLSLVVSPGDSLYKYPGRHQTTPLFNISWPVTSSVNLHNLHMEVQDIHRGPLSAEPTTRNVSDHKLQPELEQHDKFRNNNITTLDLKESKNSLPEFPNAFMRQAISPKAISRQRIPSLMKRRADKHIPKRSRKLGCSTHTTDNSSEINPMKMLEDESYQAVTDGGVKHISLKKVKKQRQRCKGCTKLKKHIKELLNKKQHISSSDSGEQGDVAEVPDQQANSVVRELTHQVAARDKTIQQLQRVLQQTEKEKANLKNSYDSLKNAYDSCLERVPTFKGELHEDNYMQPPEYSYECSSNVFSVPNLA